MIHHIKLKYILFLLISFSFVKAQEEIELENGYYSKIIAKETEDLLSFKVKVNGDYSYLKIKAEGNGDGENTNHIISFYQDQDLNNRQQLSQSVTDTSIMWLSRGQIEKDFYISIECAKIPCNFNLSLNGLNTAELGINEQYTYYVSDENEEMKFRLNSAIDYEDLEIENLFITIWTKGNFEIIATLNNDKKEKSNYHFYNIPYQNFIDDEYDLNIKGNAGDLINVGVLLVHKNGNNYDFPKLKIDEGLEVANYLSQNESHSYNIMSSKMFLGYFYDFNNKILKSIKEKDNSESSDSPSSDSPSSDNDKDDDDKDDDHKDDDHKDDDHKDDDHKEGDDKDNSDKEDDDDDDHKALIVILSIVGVIIVLSVGGGLFYYFRIYSKNRDLNQAVNQVSFKDDKENEEEDMGDSLLD